MPAFPLTIPGLACTTVAASLRDSQQLGYAVPHDLDADAEQG
jgi:hypothetical protein